MPTDPTSGRNDRSNLTSRHRLRGFDYSNPGSYFLTICTYNRQHLFGSLSANVFSLSAAGIMLERLISNLPDNVPNVTVESSVVLPNHVHLLLYFPLDGCDVSVSDVVRWLKGNSVARYRRGVEEEAWPRYDRHLWQLGFNDQVVRDDRHLKEVRRYIVENVERWEFDELNDGQW